jgi:hypothetical protein
MSNRINIKLCYPFEEKRWNSWLKEDGYAIGQFKLDGDRGRVILLPETPIQIFSSEEQDRNFALPHLVNFFTKKKSFFNNKGIFELDGEFYNHKLSHEDIHSICSRTANLHPDHEQIEFHCFDHIVGKPQVRRINDIFNVKLDSKLFQQVYTIPIYSTQELMQLKNLALECQYEGFIVRRPFEKYHRKRFTGIMKYKPSKEDTYVIIGWKEEVSIQGEPKERIGSLLLTDPEGNEFYVSAGLDDKDRLSLWTIKDRLNGKLCRVNYQAKTKYGIPKFATDLEVLL